VLLAWRKGALAERTARLRGHKARSLGARIHYQWLVQAWMAWVTTRECQEGQQDDVGSTFDADAVQPFTCTHLQNTFLPCYESCVMNDMLCWDGMGTWNAASFVDVGLDDPFEPPAMQYWGATAGFQELLAPPYMDMMIPQFSVYC